MKITFLGAAGTVTGSKYLVEHDGARILLDCGMFQGLKKLRQRNWARFAVRPESIDAVILTHAHIDHSGYLPRLVKKGFKGDVYCTPPTRDLCAILLADSAHIQVEDAKYANKKGTSRHKPALPLYTEEDARDVNPLMKTVGFGEDFTVGPFSVRFTPVGHILGAASVSLTTGEGRLLFSGDIGRPEVQMLNIAEHREEAEWIVMESTYGGRQHPERDVFDALEELIQRTIEREGILMIPAFAVGRSQFLGYAINKIFDRNPSLRVPLVLDSPMATNVTKLYIEYHDYHKLSLEECQRMCARVEFVRSVDESKELNTRPGPFILISSSGMLTGGRILHHLKAHAGDERNTILIAGYQAPGTRGADLVHGKPAVKIHGQYVKVNAEVVPIGGFSAHADHDGLMEWLAADGNRRPKRVMLVHGESDPADNLRRSIEEELGYEADVADHLETMELA